jgi:hypothetical protein
MASMKLTVVLSLFCAIAFAEKPQRPVCNAETRGQFWPAAANADRDAARKFVQQGELQMCTVHRWRYKWKSLSVNVRDLKRAKQ